MTLIPLLVFTLFSCTASVRPPSGQKHSLWKVKGKNNTVYLLGSIHVGIFDMYPLPQVMEDAFRRSDYLIVEVNIMNTDDEDFTKGMMYPPGDNLKNHLDKKTYNDLMTLAAQYDIPKKELIRFYPWVVSTIINGIKSPDSIFRDDLGIDYHFLMLNKNEKTVMELETVEEQLDVFSSASEEEQVLMLQQSLYGEHLSGDKQLLRIVEAWKTGDTEVIAKSFQNSSMQQQPQMLYNLLYKRNIHMSEKIRIYLTDKKDYFVIVGLAHLSGKGSILEILEELGYKIEQL